MNIAYTKTLKLMVECYEFLDMIHVDRSTNSEIEDKFACIVESCYDLSSYFENPDLDDSDNAFANWVYEANADIFANSIFSWAEDMCNEWQLSVTEILSHRNELYQLIAECKEFIKEHNLD